MEEMCQESEGCAEKMTSENDNINNLRKLLKINIIESVCTPFHKEEEEEISRLIQRLIECGESNSALVIGPRGSGKTSIVNNVIEKLKSDCDTLFTDCVIVRLNGFVHTDDRLALKGMAVQMHLENAVGDEAFGSFAENLSFLLQCLRMGNRMSSKSVLIILDEFDMFCHHHNQTLLYNLFDVAQSAQAPVCVIGITCRFDVVDLLEKRVKSRFSNRKIFLHSFADYNETDIVNQHLQMLQDLLSVPEKCNHKLEISTSFINAWNEKVKELCQNSSVKNFLKSMCEYTYCENEFRNALFCIVSKLGYDHRELTAEDFTDLHSMMLQNVRVLLLQGLSVLEICLVVSMMHHTLIYENAPFNFELIYARLRKFDNSHNNIIKVEREMCLKAYDHLRDLEILLPTSASQVSKEFQMFHLEILPGEVREAVKNRSLPEAVVQWAASDLM